MDAKSDLEMCVRKLQKLKGLKKKSLITPIMTGIMK